MSSLKKIAITEDGFAFDSTTGESYTLNSCGRVVLQQLQKGESQQKVAQHLANKFGIPINMAERDVADFFLQLNALGLVVGK